MSGHWVGFTEEDIKKIGSGGPKPGVKRASLGSKQQISASRHQAKKYATLEKSSHNSNASSQLSESKPLMTDLAPEALLSCPKLETEAKMNGTVGPPTLSVACPESTLLSTSPALSPNHVPVCIRIKDGKNYEVIEAQKTNLEDFQKRQKLMEEQNRCRKELLGKALADKKKQTHAEVKRLQQIQEELQKLDSLLSNDVSILRNQIEVASLEFSEAQKRYNKAEKEFLDAKLVMYGKLEHKELLTEHLCTIIEQNEMRKAKKLSELMDKLELGTVVLTEINNENEKSSSPSHSVKDDSGELPKLGCTEELNDIKPESNAACQSSESSTENEQNLE